MKKTAGVFITVTSKYLHLIIYESFRVDMSDADEPEVGLQWSQQIEISLICIAGAEKCSKTNATVVFMGILTSCQAFARVHKGHKCTIDFHIL